MEPNFSKSGKSFNVGFKSGLPPPLWDRRFRLTRVRLCFGMTITDLALGKIGVQTDVTHVKSPFLYAFPSSCGLSDRLIHPGNAARPYGEPYSTDDPSSAHPCPHRWDIPPNSCFLRLTRPDGPHES